MKLLISLLMMTLFLISCSSNIEVKKKAEDEMIKGEIIVKATLNDIQEGDIIFQTSKSSQSQAIQLATHSEYSHMGIIYRKKGEFYVCEAIQPVKFTELNEWIKRGKDEHYVVKRIKNSDKVLTPNTLLKMKKVGEQYLGKDYDLYFEWSDEKIYCSELVWKIYKEGANIEIGQLERLSDFDLDDELVQNKMRERYGNDIPIEEQVISPAEMFKSERLEIIMQN